MIELFSHYRIGEVGNSFSLLVQLEEGRQVDDILLEQPQLLLEDIPVPVDAALQGWSRAERVPSSPSPCRFVPPFQKWGL